MKPYSIRSITILWALTIIALHASTPCSAQEQFSSFTSRLTAPRTLLIFLDNSDDNQSTEKQGPVLMQALQALCLSTNPCPILISKNLLFRVFTIFNTSEHEKHLDTVKKDLISQLLGIKQVGLTEELEVLTGLIREQFDIKQWKIYGDPDVALVLLIPKNYSKDKEREWKTAQNTTFQKITPTKEYDQSLCLGINLKNDQFRSLALKSLTSFVKWVTPPQHISLGGQKRTVSTQEFQAKDFLKTFFVPKEAYKNLPNFFVPEWTIYLSGPEAGGNALVPITIPNLQKMLTFLNTTIVTKLFICYTQTDGPTGKQPYETLKNSITETYSFPIIFSSTEKNATTLTVIASKNDNSQYGLTLIPEFNVTSFVDAAEGNTPVSYMTLLADLFAANHQTLEAVAAYTPLIRLPNSNHFQLVSPAMKAVSAPAQHESFLNQLNRNLQLLNFATRELS